MASRRGALWLAGLWFFALVAPSGAQTNQPPPSAARRPCLVLILADELGYGDLGCYGQKRILTPRLNALAAGGMRFTEFHAGAPEDRSARATLLSGLTLAAGDKVPAPTLAEQLKEAGYHTGFIGYWGLGSFDSADAPQRRGFNEVVAYNNRAHALDLHADHLYRRDPHTGFEGYVPLVENQARKRAVYVPDLLTRAAVRFCRQNQPEALNGYRPFFLLLSYPVPAAVGANNGPIPETPAYQGQGWPAPQLAKANAITRLDQHVGELVDELETRGMAANTLLLFTSNLGPDPQRPLDPRFFESTGRFGLDAGHLAEGRLRLPLIVRWPFWIRTGRTTDLLTSGPDIPVTLLAAARLECPAHFTGRSFLPTLQGRDQTNRHATLQWTVAREDGGRPRAIKQEKWKLIQPGDGQPPALYDCVADPGETNNLAGQKPDVVRTLVEAWRPPAAGIAPGP